MTVTLRLTPAPYQLDHDAIDALFEAESAAALARDYRTESLSPLIAECEVQSEAHRRAARIVNRICPAPRIPAVAWTDQSLAAHAATLDRRAELFTTIRSRMADKVRVRLGLIVDARLVAHSVNHNRFNRENRA